MEHDESDYNLLNLFTAQDLVCGCVLVLAYVDSGFVDQYVEQISSFREVISPELIDDCRLASVFVFRHSCPVSDMF